MPHPFRRISPAGVAMVFGLLGLAAAPNAWCAQQRSFVESTGVDTNPCTLTSPCRSFNAAIAQTNPGGEVVILDTAGYGPMTIAKSIKIIGPTGVYGGISVLGGAGGITTGIVINAGDTDVVTLRGLDVAGVPGAAPLPLYGIDVQNVGTLHIEKSSISNFTQDASACIRAVSAKAQQIFVDDSFLRECRTGIAVNGTGPDDSTTVVVLADNTRIERGANTTGGATLGIGIQGFGAVTFRNSLVLTHNVAVQMDSIATNGQTILALWNSQLIGGDTCLNVNNTSAGGIPNVSIVGSQLYGCDDGIIYSNAGAGAGAGGSLRIADSYFEHMNNGITATTGADAALGIDVVRSQLTRIQNTAISVAASAASGLGLHLRDTTLSEANTLLKTSGTSGIQVTLIRSHLRGSVTAIDHGRGRIRMEQTTVSANVNSLVNNGSPNIVSAGIGPAGTNWIIDNIDTTAGTIYITPTVIPMK
jgi:hypothetical protein